MAANSEIGWLHLPGHKPHTHNVVTGCDMVSEGCGQPRTWDDPGEPPDATGGCYAKALAPRLKGMEQGAAAKAAAAGRPAPPMRYQTDGRPPTSGPGFGVAMHPDLLGLPLTWREPRCVFICSMSDIFHPRVSDGFLAELWAVMALTPQHTYRVLTKRSKRMRALLSRPDFQARMAEAVGRLGLWSDPDVVYDTVLAAPWPLPNVSMGVSAETQARAEERLPDLMATPAALRWVSAEPLLGPLDLAEWLRPWPGYCQTCGAKLARPTASRCDDCGRSDYDDGDADPRQFARLDWVVAGGESGGHARPAHPGWFRSLRDQCQQVGVAYFFKQWGRWGPPTGQTTPSGATALVHWDGRWQPMKDTRSPARGTPLATVMQRHAGKHDTGNELDGQRWEQFPELHTGKG
jgi:protein gp37